MKKTFKIACVMLGLSLGTNAQQTWGLQDCIDYALKNNIQIQKNRISQEKGEVALWKNKGALFPSLSFSSNQNVGYRPFTQVMSTVQGDQVINTADNVTYQGSYGLNASVTLWNGGIDYKNIKEQKIQNEISKLQTEQSELSIQEQIAQLYVQIMYTKEALKVNEQLQKTAQSQYDRGVEMQKQGQMANADVVQLEAQLSSANYDIVNSKAQLENYKRQLKALLELREEIRDLADLQIVAFPQEGILSFPNGKDTVTFFRLLPVHPFSVMTLAGDDVSVSSFLPFFFFSSFSSYPSHKQKSPHNVSTSARCAYIITHPAHN